MASSNGSADTRDRRQRSPLYPSDGLETCAKNAKKIYDAEKRSTTSNLVAAKHLGYTSLSGASRTALASMKRFGLLVEEAGEKVRVSDEAVKLLMAPDDDVRLPLLRHIALKPDIIRELLAEHPDGLPSDDTLKYKLVADRGFGEDAAKALIRSLRETVRFARLGPGEYTTAAS